MLFTATLNLIGGFRRIILSQIRRQRKDDPAAGKDLRVMRALAAMAIIQHKPAFPWMASRPRTFAPTVRCMTPIPRRRALPKPR